MPVLQDGPGLKQAESEQLVAMMTGLLKIVK
jgi:hypothetical protein